MTTCCLSLRAPAETLQREIRSISSVLTHIERVPLVPLVVLVVVRRPIQMSQKKLVKVASIFKLYCYVP